MSMPGNVARYEVLEDGRLTAAPALTVLCAPRDAVVLTGMVAMPLARRSSGGVVLVAVWDEHSAGIPIGGPARTRTKAAAERLRAVGIDCCVRGRLVVIALPAAGSEAIAVLGRATQHAPDAPLVVVLAGPRRPGFDGLLAGTDRVLIGVSPDTAPEIRELALVDAARVGRATGCLVAPTSALSRLLGAHGLAGSSSFRDGSS
jgi:hypothetical protein